MGMVQEGQPILKEQWSMWDAESIAQQEAQEYQGIDFDMASVNSDSTVLYDIDADMILDHNIVECESVHDMNVVDDLPYINQLRAELKVLGGSDSPRADFNMPTDYYPSTPRYSPISSPAYSPGMSPLTINIHSESEHGFTLLQQDGPIVTRPAEIFNLPNDDSDNELDREVELINMMVSYVNRNKLPIQINAVYVFPQSNSIHDHVQTIVLFLTIQISPLLNFT